MGNSDGLKMNMLDRAIAYINPFKARDRMEARKDLAILNYEDSGASMTDSALIDFLPVSRSPTEEIDNNREMLGIRTRRLYMSSPIARAAINKYHINGIGSGLKVKPNLDIDVLGIKKEEAALLEKRIKRKFEIYASSTNCDYSRMFNFYTLQTLALITSLVSGDALAIPCYKKRAGVKTRLCLRLVEGDLIASPYGRDNEYIKNGVEFNKSGELEAYHVAKKHPGDLYSNIETIRLKAFGKGGNRLVYHIFEPERPGQRRGVPLLSPVISALKQHSRYSDSELMAAVIGAMYTVFVTTDATNEPLKNLGIDKKKNNLPDKTVGMKKGGIVKLAPGEKVDVANPGRPNANYATFVDAIITEIGAGIGVPREVLLTSFNSNYSAAKAALDEAWKGFIKKRDMITLYMCQPFYEEWLTEQVALGELHLPGFMESEEKRLAYSRAYWVGPSKSSLDPFKEVRAAKERVELGISNREIEAGSIGNDYEEVNKQLVIENSQLKEVKNEE